ncbi:uncharacterized protein N0V89_000253 [Didymosphaeria variabile]|uniref:Uncharacterized protein n=1 Tax=Didymosphaeria variabile TaxID=1932322 RepID=A0A9W8XWF0_9PLEO|nr:uncharacterized protein N0V89_000253 [Didymosphaeria variabile]KAJ4359697.1 hypothetical protein N0V89_000253 [Didymosphaeria variabile]
MADRNYKSYQLFGPTNRLESNLRKGDYWTPNSERVPRQGNTSSVPAAPSNAHDNPYIDQSTEEHGEGGHRLPIVYDREIESLIGRTIRAYRLVVDYERACPIGRRWIPEHIRMIQEAGKYLESDRVVLNSLRATLARGGDAVPVGKIRANAHDLRDYCREILELIKAHEQFPLIDGRAVGVQFRDHFAEAEGVKSIQHDASRERSETPVRLRDRSSLAQPDKYIGSGRRGDGRGFGGGYDSWRPT